MDSDYDEPKFLFIYNVFIKDCMSIGDLFEQKFISKITNTTNNTINYKKLPTIFTSKEEWVQQTNIKCWYCHLNFDNMPIFIPKLIEKKDGDISIYTNGCFCSFSCAMSYINLYNKDICDRVNVEQKLKFLYSFIYDINISHIKESPSIYNLKHYGGTYTIDEYKTLIKSLNKI